MASLKRPGAWRAEHGAELIEFALVCPILVLLIGGLMEFGMVFRSLEVVTNAAREGARVAVLPAYGTADVQSRVTQYMNAAGMTGPYAVAVSDVPVTTGAGTFTAREITVTYTYQVASLAAIATFFGGGFDTVPLTGRSVMRIEAPAAAPGS